MRMWRLATGGQRCRVLLFGTGLVGSAIARALRIRFQSQGEPLPYDWQDADLRRAQRDAIRGALETPDRVILVWAAGCSGFGSSAEDMACETALVAELVAFACQIKADRPATTVDAHLLSSAGGLFEGQTHCTAASLPRPLRPYGHGKLAQETLLRQATTLDGRHVHRPSTVYGAAGTGRVGLVAALIGNALKGATTRIFGSPGTLRDYVLADDIGRYVASRIGAAGTGAVSVHLLAAGRPTAVHEIIELVGRCLDLPLRLQFDPHPTNTRNMSFLPSALPAGWNRTPLATGIALLAHARPR